MLNLTFLYYKPSTHCRVIERHFNIYFHLQVLSRWEEFLSKVKPQDGQVGLHISVMVFTCVLTD